MRETERKSGHDESKVERARQWLEGLTKKGAPGFQGDDVGRADADADTDTFFDLVCFSGLTVSRATNAHIVCYFQIPAHLADADGNWHAGAIATIIDNVGAAAIMTVTGSIPISVDFNISYFSPAKSHDEVEVEARVVEYKGIVTMVAVEIRKKHDGQLVASGRQWMATATPSRLRTHVAGCCKLVTLFSGVIESKADCGVKEPRVLTKRSSWRRRPPTMGA